MRNALKSIKRMRLMSFLIVIQLAISLAMVNRTAAVVEGYIKKVDGFNRVIGEEKTYIIKLEDVTLGNILNENATRHMNGEEVNNREINLRWYQLFYEIKDFNKELERLKAEGIIKNIFVYYPDTLGENFKDLVNDEYKKDTSNEDEISNTGVFPNEEFWSISVNYDFINNYKLPIYEGRRFTKEDFNIDYRKEPIPIILGKGYNENVKIGDVLEKKYNFEKYVLTESTEDKLEKYLGEGGNLQGVDVNLRFKVIGFYDDNAIPGMFSQENIIKYVRFSNTYTIIPCVKDLPHLNEVVSGIGLGNYIQVDSEAHLKKIKEELGPKLKEKGMELKITDLGEEYEKVKEVMAREVLTSGTLGVVLMILSIVGITSVLLGEVNERKREFGIRIGSGATISTLCKEMILEIMIMVIMAALLSILLIFRNDKSISINLMMINIGVMGIITLIISIIPIMRLRKMNPVDLVRGK